MMKIIETCLRYISWIKTPYDCQTVTVKNYILRVKKEKLMVALLTDIDDNCRHADGIKLDQKFICDF